MIGVLGANGFVGRSICSVLKNRKIKFKKITRTNFLKFQKFKFDILINSSMPSKRFWAKKNPSKDYEETVNKTLFFCKKYKYKKFIHLSSISSRCQKNTIYGKNKYLSELIVKKLKNYTIYRLGPMYSKTLDKGVLIDLKNSKSVFVNKKSKYSFTDLRWISNYIVKNLRSNKNKIEEIGSFDYYVLEDLKKIVKSKSKFRGAIDNQLIKNKKMKNLVSSKNVINFFKKI
jgi:dTDP-4-dehydrorhamnose reductase